MKMFLTTFILISLILIYLRTKGQTIGTENVIEKLQNWNQNSGFDRGHESGNAAGP